ncbi:MAG: Bax inhibitor-1/YccA family protein [Oxalobacter sp.]|nr:MAG: Bax inhibitor-1/YccA family protein [Oxalobacter sp.]
MNQRYKSFRADVMTSATTVSTHMSDEQRSVLRNTYLLLSMCLAFSATVAGTAVILQLPHPGIVITLIGFFGLWFLVNKYRTSWAGVALTFALTGFMGYTLGPIIGHYLKLPNGSMTVMMAMGGTAAIFTAMSAYALVSKRDLSFLGGMLAIGVLVAFLAALVALFMNIPALSLTVSAAFVLLMSGMILYETSRIVRGGETNYIIATVSLFVSIFNLFTSLLHILGFVNQSE